MMNNVSLHELREIFDLVDTDKSGDITADEFERLLDIVQVEMTQDEVVVMINGINSTGMVTFQNFIDLMSSSVQINHTRQDIMNAFQNGKIRPAPKGYIHSADVFELLTKFGATEKCLTISETEMILGRLKSDAEGYICYKDMVDEIMAIY